MPVVDTVSAASAAVIALAFATLTFKRWIAKRRRHELAWSVSLAMFAFASAVMAVGSAGKWNGIEFRLFFLFGAILNVPFLALGTAYLLGGERRGDRWAIVVALWSAFSVGVLVAAPLTHSLPPHRLAQGSAVFGLLPQVLAAVGSGVGALVVIAGAVWSGIHRRGGRMLAANVLIAVGTTLSGMSGLLNSVLDQMTGFAVMLALGVSVIFAGFLVATTGGLAIPAEARSKPET